MADRLETPNSRLPPARARKKMEDQAVIRERDFYLYYSQRPKPDLSLSRHPTQSPVHEVPPTLPASPAPPKSAHHEHPKTRP
ncbi:hypothetical protein JI435_412790 [Parastagonospora nodorum SN15]|uniref:Uncharacterized protein n=1 Tax=Phaeosphaeria nodorum (strain SN15 / ATCC MYA-4574 / FGSC 10173) TaxID=321614 RepID=A0A7U2F556_PHANO|nr:hypothetical protein JI435_412790 [Parastagonospora nodorum SN15]